MSCLASHALRVRHGCRNEINKALTGASRDQAVHRSDGPRPVRDRGVCRFQTITACGVPPTIATVSEAECHSVMAESESGVQSWTLTTRRQGRTWLGEGTDRGGHNWTAQGPAPPTLRLRWPFP